MAQHQLTRRDATFGEHHVSREQGRLGDVAVHLRSLARIDAEQSQHERAVQIYGAASHLDTLETTIPTDDSELHAEYSKLCAPRWASALQAEWVTGASLPLKQAITLALSSSHI